MESLVEGKAASCCLTLSLEHPARMIHIGMIICLIENTRSRWLDTCQEDRVAGQPPVRWLRTVSDRYRLLHAQQII